ncbi:DUF1223 domain-containing protein [Winogradskyella maritima]|uniref:DUF1223 domain-containing protein n=1 Tax=Winogradskyella maritima TaxID=1517766 RepID=A0ABV8AL03_9FLAO|nr:DUF1223 domain-containing protein [Winogradskyella maritima]
MKALLLTVFIIPVLLYTPNERPMEKSPVVLELFTSQGCSSCPPADRLLSELASEDIIALSYHVDYWNYIGWKDPFSKESYTDLQRQYSKKFNSSTIYTPQLVLNGKTHVVGSDRNAVARKIEAYGTSKGTAGINIANAKTVDGFVEFNYNASGQFEDQTLRIILVIKERKTSVKRGENRNRNLVNSNIVINEQRFSLKENSGEGRIAIPDIVKSSDELSLVLILQDDNLDINGGTIKSL